jgi:hypothetical protein
LAVDDLADWADEVSGVGGIEWTEVDDDELRQAFLREYERAFGRAAPAPESLHIATAPGQVRLTLGGTTFTVDWNGTAEQRREIVIGFAWALRDMDAG